MVEGRLDHVFGSRNGIAKLEELKSDHKGWCVRWDNVEADRKMELWTFDPGWSKARTGRIRSGDKNLDLRRRMRTKDVHQWID